MDPDLNCWLFGYVAPDSLRHAQTVDRRAVRRASRQIESPQSTRYQRNAPGNARGQENADQPGTGRISCERGAGADGDQVVAAHLWPYPGLKSGTLSYPDADPQWTPEERDAL